VGVVIEPGIYGNVVNVGTMDGESIGPILSEAIEVRAERPAAMAAVAVKCCQSRFSQSI